MDKIKELAIKVVTFPIVLFAKGLLVIGMLLLKKFDPNEKNKNK